MATPEEIGALLRAMRLPAHKWCECWCFRCEAEKYFRHLGYELGEPGDGPYDLKAVALDVFARVEDDEDGDSVDDHIYGDRILLALVPEEVAYAYQKISVGFWYE